MADGIPPNGPGMDPPPAPQPEPPPLSSIRVKGPGGRGLNKMAILATAGGGLALVLVLASGAFSPAPARAPAEMKLIMSDPARPEMAKGAVRELPSDYTEVATIAPAVPPADPPQLGPPLPGDIAAFAPSEPGLRSYSDGAAAGSWDEPLPYVAPADADPAVDEEKEAERSAIFFALREPAPSDAGRASLRTPSLQPPNSRLTAFAPQPGEPAPPARGDRVLFPGAVIPASLVTGLNSETPGPVIAQVTQPTYDSATGRTLLIPQGARLIGDYRSTARYGQSRVAITWSRLVMPDGSEIALNEAALDPSGAAGVSGEVDNHWGDVLGAAALGTVINVGVATTEDPVVVSGLGIASRDPVDDAIADGVQRTASNVTNRVVDRGLAIPPTIRVPSGTKLVVIVSKSLRL